MLPEAENASGRDDEASAFGLEFFGSFRYFLTATVAAAEAVIESNQSTTYN